LRYGIKPAPTDDLSVFTRGSISHAAIFHDPLYPGKPAIAISFGLWVIDADQAPYKRADFPSYAECIVRGRAEVDSLKSLAPDVSWPCVPDDDDQGRENHRDEGEW
jgi:hypothetical protein